MEVEQLEHKPAFIWVAGTTGSCFTHYTRMPALSGNYLKRCLLGKLEYNGVTMEENFASLAALEY